MYDYKPMTLNELMNSFETIFGKYSCEYPEGKCDCSRSETNCSSISSTVIKNDSTEAVVEIVLPGYKKEEISVKVVGKYLVVSVDGVRGKKSVKRAITETADVDKISAKFENGILTVTIPVKPATEIKVS